MICRKCGADIPDNSTVCAVCASTIVKREPVSQPVAQRPMAQRPVQSAVQNSEIPRPVEFRSAPIQPITPRPMPTQPVAQRQAPTQPATQCQAPAQPVAQRPAAQRPTAPPPVGFRPAPARPAPARPAAPKPEQPRPEQAKPAVHKPEQAHPEAVKPSAKISKQSRPAKKKSAAQLSKQLRKKVVGLVAQVKNILKSDDEKKKKFISLVGGISAAVLIVLVVLFSSLGKFFGKLELYDTLSTCEWECETEKTSGYFGYSYNDTEEIRFNYPEFGFKGIATFDESRYEYKIKSSKKIVIDGIKYKVKFNDVDGDGVHDEMIFEASGKDKENAKFAKNWECTSEYHGEFKVFEDTWSFVVKGWQNMLK